MISGNWLIGVLGALSTAAVAVIGKLKLDQAKRERTSTRIENLPITVSLVETLATKEEMASLEARLVAEIKKLEGSLGKERDVARTANGNLHARIDKTSDNLSLMRGEIGQMNANLNRLIDLAMNPKPRPSAR